jgi:hypothetical protein
MAVSVNANMHEKTRPGRVVRYGITWVIIFSSMRLATGGE